MKPSAQINDKLTVSLQPGDPMPDVNINLRNYPFASARVSDFRRKLLIFDFWDITCKSCIQSMPKMEALQKQFNDRIQIILVTKSTDAQVERLFTRSAIARDCSLPSIIGDTVLTRLFEFHSVPTHVWIDEQGIVNQFMGPYTTQKTIETYLSGRKLNLPIKKEYRDFNARSPLIKEGSGRQLKHLQFYSAIFKKIDDDGGRVSSITDSVNQIAGYKFVNLPVLMLYQYAYITSELSPDYRYLQIALEMDNSGRLIRPSDKNDGEALAKWDTNTLFCYESSVPFSKRSVLSDLMRRDLEGFFGFKANVEKRKMPCIILDVVDSAKMNRPLPTVDYPGNSAVPIKFKATNQPLLVMLNYLKDKLYYQNVPVICAIDKLTNVTVALKSNPKDFDALSAELNQYGLSLYKEERFIDVLVLRD